MAVLVAVSAAAWGAPFLSRWMEKGKAAFKANGGNKVAVVTLDGPILDVRETVRWLRTLGRDVPGLKAVVLAIDSPGGGVAASQELYDAVRRLKDDGKKVVVSMGSVAASGGYYAACPADRILAHPGTLTGSIGVIMETGSASRLMDKIGLKFDSVKSGRYKDTGTLFRDMRQDEKEVLQGVIDDVYDQFVGAIVESRHDALARVLRRENGENPTASEIRGYVRDLADGRIYSGRQAWNLGLVDEMGGLQDAIRVAGELAGIKGEPQVITQKHRASFAEILGLSRLSLFSSLQPLIPGSGTKISYSAW
jgi:protease-4